MVPSKNSIAVAALRYEKWKALGNNTARAALLRLNVFRTAKRSTELTILHRDCVWHNAQHLPDLPIFYSKVVFVWNKDLGTAYNWEDCFIVNTPLASRYPTSSELLSILSRLIGNSCPPFRSPHSVLSVPTKHDVLTVCSSRLICQY